MKSTAPEKHQSYRVVREGMTATFEVQGGWRRAEVPSDGIIVETDRSTVFISKMEMQEALEALK